MLKINKRIYNDCYLALQKLPKNYFDLIILDPPSGKKLVKAKWDNWKNEDEYIEWLTDILLFSYSLLKYTGSLYCFQWIGEKNPLTLAKFLLKTNQKTLLKFKDMITWKKQRGYGNRKGWMYTREELLWYVKDNKKFIWNTEHQYDLNDKRLYTIKGSKNKSEFKRFTNVWTDIMEMGFGTCPKKFKESREKYGEHETPKPPELFERMIKAHTKENDNILIPFSGSGVEEETCKKLNRNFISFYY